MSGSKFVIHLVLPGGAVADDVYVGPFRYEDRAVEKAEAIDRKFGTPVALVRELLPCSTSLAEIEREAGWA